MFFPVVVILTLDLEFTAKITGKKSSKKTEKIKILYFIAI